MSSRSAFEVGESRARFLMDRPGSNVDVVRRVYDLDRRYLRGEREPVISGLHELVRPDAVATPSSALSSGSIGPYYGPQRILRFWDAMLEAWSTFDLIPDEVVDAPPDRVVAICRVVARHKDGRGFAGRVAHVWRLEEVMVVEALSFQSPDRAFDHARLRRGAGAKEP